MNSQRSGAHGWAIVASEIDIGQAGLLKPGMLRWARALGWLLVLAVLCVFAFNLAADASLRASALVAGETFTTRANAPAAARLIAIIVGSAAMLAAYALAVVLAERRKPNELSLIQAPGDLIIGCFIGSAIIALIIGTMWIAGWVTITPTPVVHLAVSLKQALQSGVIEEVLIRLIVFRLLWRATSFWPALIVTALLFGGLHLSNPGATMFSALCLVAGEGIGAGLYLLTGRIWMPIGMHVAWNFTQGWIFGAAVSGLDVFAGGPLQTLPAPGVDSTLSGAGFGPESTVASLCISLLASAIFLGAAWKRGRLGSPQGS
jgi:membrane protease YdiL (CAAX protease family)